MAHAIDTETPEVFDASAKPWYLDVQKPMVTLFNKPTCKWYILPSEELRRLVVRRMLAKHRWINYVVLYKDVNGYGVEMSHVSWVDDGLVYWNR
jgi:hypothetical protein